MKYKKVLCEYYMLKKAVRDYKLKFDCSYAKYVNVKPNVHFSFKNNVVKSIREIRSNFYYSIFIELKFQKPLLEKKRTNTFNIQGVNTWKYIYRNKILNVYEKRISEFNYKLLHGILNNNAALSKWNKVITPLCENCEIEDDMNHLLFDCKIVKPLSVYMGKSEYFSKI